MAECDVCVWQGPLCVCHAGAMLPVTWNGEVTACIELTNTPLSAELKQGSGTRVWVAASGIALAKYNIRQQVKSYLIEPKSPARPPRHIVFANRNRARQNGSTELSFCTVTACYRLLGSIKTSQIHAHSCTAYLLQWKPYTAVLTQTFNESK